LLFDTSVLIDYLRQSDLGAVYFVELVIAGLQLGYCSAVVEAALWTGVRNNREAARITALLERFTTIPFTSETARLAGNLLRGKSEGEIKAHFADALIAATTQEIGQSILTADGKSRNVFGDRVNYLVYR
jgi:predicted nucleic acid-binding protein